MGDQVLRYGPGQKYDMHKDVLGTIRNGHTGENPRISTVLLYLSDVESGGETAFPLSNKWANANAQVGNKWGVVMCSGIYCASSR